MRIVVYSLLIVTRQRNGRGGYLDRNEDILVQCSDTAPRNQHPENMAGNCGDRSARSCGGELCQKKQKKLVLSHPAARIPLSKSVECTSI